MSNANEAAFPLPTVELSSREREWGVPGLTKREYFAGLAMQGLVAAPVNISRRFIIPDEAAERALEYADALLAELAKEPQP